MKQLAHPSYPVASHVPMPPREIVIFGAGGLAREVAFLIEEINRRDEVWRLLGYVDKDSDRVGTIVGNYPIMATESEISGWIGDAVIAVGDPALVQTIRAKISDYPGLTFPNLIHPSVVWDAATVSMGEGNMIFPGAVLTVNINLGSFNILNMNTSFGHDVAIDDCCVIGPGVSVGGGVQVGKGCLLGMGSQIYQYRTIGPGATVGMGSAVVSDVPPNTTVIGVPARPLPSATQENEVRLP